MDLGSTNDARPLILTQDEDLLDQLLRLCAAANVAPDHVVTVELARRSWAGAAAVFVGDDMAPDAARLGLARRDHVVLVSAAHEQAPLWRLAVELRADDVAVLPAAQVRLMERLRDLADGSTRGTTIGVIGGCGGAGSTTLAAGLALTAAKRGRRSLLIDADPLGGGIDLVVGCEDQGGVRWSEVAATHGRVGAAALRSALPTVGGLAVLSWDTGGPAELRSETMRAMLGAAQRGSDLVVIDLPRRLDDAAVDAVTLADALVLVVTSEVRAVAGAQTVLRMMRQLFSDIRIAVRELPGSDLAPKTIAETLGLPLVSTVPTHRSVARSINDGLGPLGRRSFARVCDRLLDDTLAAARR